MLLFDEPIGRRLPALRVVGYGAIQTSHGVQWGGPEACKFYKDFRMPPVEGGPGLQVDSANREMLHLALQLRMAVYRLDRFCPKAARLQPQLPRLWAGFSREDSETLHGGGPELTALCEKFDLEPDAMLRKFQYEHQGLCCFPLEWVSDQTSRSLAIFADLREMPRTQVFRLPLIPEGLQGFQGAAAYDFFHSRQREQYAKCLERRSRRVSEPVSEPSLITPLAPVEL